MTEPMSLTAVLTAFLVPPAAALLVVAGATGVLIRRDRRRARAAGADGPGSVV
ncbi:hypothetical protein ABZ858_33430 [Streptomyces sp. NPDC047017]|uniref:hypothetical protein n=1 Tax=Streptomyces sp. NPDC047017 TaxID=3155024 RepID=UPI0033D4679C